MSQQSDVGVECWAFNYRRYNAYCELILTTQPHLLACPTFHEKDDQYSLYIRECYTSEYARMGCKSDLFHFQRLKMWNVTSVLSSPWQFDVQFEEHLQPSSCFD